MYLFKIDITTYKLLEDCICEIAEIISKYYKADDFEITETYEDREFQYNKFEIQINNDVFYFELFHKQYNFENNKMYGFYRIVASTSACIYEDDIEEIISQYNKNSNH